MGLGQNHAVLGDPSLQCFKAGLEVGQVMPQPDRTDAGGRDKDTLLAQLVGGAGLTIGRKLQRGFDHRLLGGFTDAVGKIGFAPGALEQGLDAAFLNRGLVAVKGVARHAHDLAGTWQGTWQAFDTLPSSSARFSNPVLCLMILSVVFNIVVSSFCGWCAPPSKRTTTISIKRCAAPIPACWEGSGVRSHRD